MSGFLSRGFTGRRRIPPELAGRVPPGQYVEQGFPVLTAGPTPRIDPDEWGLRVDGMVAEPRAWTAAEFRELPFETVPCDIHCVTKWSKLGTSFRGVSLDVLLEAVEPLGAYAMAYSYGDYTTNLAPAGWTGHTGRLDAGLIGEAAAGAMTAYVCGSNGFVEAASTLLLEAAVKPEGIRTERFGPTG